MLRTMWFRVCQQIQRASSVVILHDFNYSQCRLKTKQVNSQPGLRQQTPGKGKVFAVREITLQLCWLHHCCIVTISVLESPACPAAAAGVRDVGLLQQQGPGKLLGSLHHCFPTGSRSRELSFQD